MKFIKEGTISIKEGPLYVKETYSVWRTGDVRLHKVGTLCVGEGFFYLEIDPSVEILMDKELTLINGTGVELSRK